MAKKLKMTMTGAWVGSAVLVLAGVLLLVNPDFGSAAVASVIGWGMIIVAAICLVAGILTWPALGFTTMGGSCIGLLLGVYILKNPLALASLLGVVLGIFLAAQGLGALGDALRLWKGGRSWVVAMVLAAATLVLGVTLIFSPLTTSRFVMIIAGVVMVVCGVGNLVTHFKATRYIDGTSDKETVIDSEN